MIVFNKKINDVRCIMSNYIDRNLVAGEETIKKAQLNSLFLLGRWILGILFFWMLLIPTVIAIISTIQFKNIEFGFTNKRIIGKTGVLGIKTFDAPLNKIQSISVTQSFFGKIFNFSTVRIDTAAGGPRFVAVKYADNFKRALMNEIDNYEEALVKRQSMEMANAMSAALKSR